MTTLPQTAGSRFPRAGSRTPAVLAAPTGPALPPQQGLTPADVLRVLRVNAWLIIVTVLVFMVMGIAVNELVLKRFFGRYTAEVLLQVRTPNEINPFGANPAGQSTPDMRLIEIRQQTQAQLLRDPRRWMLAWANPESRIRQTGWWRSFQGSDGNPDVQKAVKNLERRLRISPVPETELIQVSMSASNAEDAVVVLREIIRKHIELDRDVNNASQSDERRALNDILTRSNQRIAQLTTTINERAAALNTGTRGGVRLGSVGLLEVQLTSLLGERVKATNELSAAESTFNNIASQLDAGQVPLMVQFQLDSDPNITQLRREVEALDSEIQILLDTMSANHTYIRQLERRRDESQRRLDNNVDRVRLQLGQSVREQAAMAVSAARSAVGQFDAQIGELERRLGELSRQMSEYLTALDERDAERQRAQQVTDRLNILQANTTRQEASRSSIWWTNSASLDGEGAVERPMELSFPRLDLTLGLAFILGLGLSLGIAFLRELLDNSVRSPRDINRVGNLNLLGMIPHEEDDPQAAATSLPLAISQAPHSIIAENFRQVRTRLQHAASLEAYRSIVVTSPGPGDGKTTVTCNLAASLALNGRKVLLVDANFRRPDLHKVFGVPNDNGFGDVLAKKTPIDSVARKTNVANLSVLPTGPRPSNATELIESQALSDFLDRAFEAYDFVIFDSGPVLLVSETVALAPRVDAVLSVVRANSNSRGQLGRMRDALRQLKAEHLGVVLNGVRTQGGGYYGRNIKSYYEYQDNA
jgi:capsular exopolysaccharide synthesis family protein